MTTTAVQSVPSEIFSNPSYFGKHIVVVDHEVYEATTGEEAVRILEEVRKKYPGKQPVLAYIPKEETLILVGRQQCLEVLSVLLESHTTTFRT